ncbi:hypothetical protein OK351_03460 [Glutamicibacter sp. MNS18]|uniref:hypothetical protein n=1 Tax=Glutamicibacter sp. MNS18 TaxID=2989817 RepID=UPI002235D294|nr:hypothetical protein [Glutamicibacter sp. MNS18]MCW4464564.1 hypothetical protein [Glutamicibacter sp. MNS18]
MDLRINSIEANVTQLDDRLLRDPEFISRLAAAVRRELERDQAQLKQREADQSPRVKRRL